MPSPGSEEIILSSNDNSVTLTTHRLLQKTAKVNKEMMLTDMVSHEIVYKKSLFYIILSLLFGIPAIVSFALFLAGNGPFEETNVNPPTSVLWLLAFLTLLAIIVWATRADKFLRITGRFNEIDIPINRLSQNSLNKFLNRLEVESNNSKREM
jgi:hypothetical protein